MKVDINKTYHTKDGHPVVIYAVYESQTYAMHGAYQCDDGKWRSASWQLNGRFFDAHTPSSLDLVGVRPEREVWINEDKDGHLDVCTCRDQANEIAFDDRTTLHRVVLNEDTVWREGDDE